MTLHDLAEKYHCDKLSNHSYVPFYSDLFANLKVSRFLEIGIGYEDLMRPFVDKYIHGASLYMWQEFFGDAAIFSCDIREETLINDEAKRIWSRHCDQSKPVDLWRLLQWSGGAFDAIVDDGCHEPDVQILTAAVLLPHVRKGGVYIVEDVREPERVAAAIGGTPHILGKRPDDNLVVIHK